jgi:hypothetical protein
VRYGHAALLHGRSLVVTHGYYHSPKFGSCFQSDTWTFDVDVHVWQQLFFPGSAVPTARFEHTVASDGEFMYMFGGTDGGARFNGGKTFLFGPQAEMNDLWRMNLTAPHEWCDVSGDVRPEARCEHGSAWASGQLWVFGGLQGDASGTADGLRAAGDLWSWSPGGNGWREHSTPTPAPRYGHGCVSGRRSGSLAKDADGFFVVGGRQRHHKAREILDEVWWADTSSGSSVAWQALATPGSRMPAWAPRFHFAACAFETVGHASARGGLIVYGGNVSTGLLRLPVDGVVYCDASEGGEEAVASGWAPLSVAGPVDAEGQVHPYGRVHATVVLVPPNQAEPLPRLLIFGGESTRPYMYHASVWEVKLAQPL